MVDGEVFLTLTSSDLLEMKFKLGVRKKLEAVVQQLGKESGTFELTMNGTQDSQRGVIEVSEC